MTRMASERATTPQDCDRLFAERANAGDVDGVLALYEPDARFVRRDGTVVQGVAELRVVITSLTASQADLQMHVARVVESGDIAVIYNDWVSTTKIDNGAVAQRAGRALEIVRRQPDGTWLFAIDDPFGRDRIEQAAEASRTE